MEIKNSFPPEVAMGKVSTATPLREPSIQNAQTANPVPPTQPMPKLETSYSYDREVDMFIVKVTDKNKMTPNDVVKQLPPEYMVDLAKDMDKLIGNVIDTEA